MKVAHFVHNMCSGGWPISYTKYVAGYLRNLEIAKGGVELNYGHFATSKLNMFWSFFRPPLSMFHSRTIKVLIFIMKNVPMFVSD
jgi:hypothetical protein